MKSFKPRFQIKRMRQRNRCRDRPNDVAGCLAVSDETRTLVLLLPLIELPTAQVGV